MLFFKTHDNINIFLVNSLHNFNICVIFHDMDMLQPFCYYTFLYCKVCTIASNVLVIIQRHLSLPTFLSVLITVVVVVNTFSTCVPGTVLNTLYTLSHLIHTTTL